MNIPVNKPIFDGNEKKYLMDCIDTGWLSSAGEYIEKFEAGMAKFADQKYGVAVSNGTVALETAVQALELEKGSEIILPDFTIISCVQAIVKAGMVPVMVDCTYDTWNMDVTAIEEKITSKTRAIMVVHIYGMPTQMDTVLALAKKYNLYVIEDSAEAHGLTYKGRMCGSMSDISTFSFFPNKHITCGEGGMVLTSDEKIFRRSQSIRNLFFDEERRYIHSEFGSNFRMTNMQAAIGLAQLEKINKTLLKKREIGKRYREELADVDFFRLPIEKTEYADNLYWVFGLVVEDDSVSADYVMKKLGECGIGTRHFFFPMHKQPALINAGICSENQLDDSMFQNSNYISEHGLYIPSGIGITDEEQTYVIKKIRELFR